MATVTHYIYSHYDPNENDSDEAINDTKQSGTTEGESADPWENVNAFGTHNRLQRAPPRFVPATQQTTDWFSSTAVAKSPELVPSDDNAGNETVSFYRGLVRRKLDAPASTISAPTSETGLVTSNAIMASVGSSTSSDAPVTKEPRDKNNWFITRVLAGEDVPRRTATPTSSLADMLSRNPPPKPNEPAFTPPVFLAIGPSNRGFAMLQQSGWSEGEALGPDVVRRGNGAVEFTEEEEWDLGTAKRKRSLEVKLEQREIELEDDVCEVRKVEVVDLTLSEDEDDTNVAQMPSAPAQAVLSSAQSPLPSSDSPRTGWGIGERRALLTPIPTVLKSDRLGIGLKAKTEGPYRASKKRVTHNSAALAAHIRAGEVLQREKTLYGRGKRGFDQMSKKEEARRQNLMQYLNE